ncbi:MAG: hypothetical protein M3O01_13735, partial [Pseudomonadota bacterium]|nr:hypothetical protein [Pseudomonadota bacterium]
MTAPSALFAAQHVLLEQRMATREAETAAAFEAAEAGLDWALGMLNGRSRVDPHCQPADGSGALSFRDHMLARDSTSGRFLPTGREVRCRGSGDLGWSCRCGANDDVVATPAADVGPAFRVGFAPDEARDVAWVHAIGCNRA